MAQHTLNAVPAALHTGSFAPSFKDQGTKRGPAHKFLLKIAKRIGLKEFAMRQMAFAGAAGGASNALRTGTPQLQLIQGGKRARAAAYGHASGSAVKFRH